MKHTVITLLAQALSLQASTEVHLVPAGEFVGRDGRPGKGRKWTLSNQQGRALATRLNERHQTVRFNFDYEHQVFLSEKNGQPAPASGWAQRFEWRDDRGLFALDVQWTERARQMLEAGEYLYLSPALRAHKETLEVVDLVNASLVNVPALEELDPVAQERLERLNAHFLNQEPSMNELLKALLLALGLKEDTTPDAATASVTALKAKAAQADTLGTEVTALKAKVETAETEVTTLKAKAEAGEVDTTKWVSIDRFTALSQEVTTLKASHQADEVERLIESAEAEGKCSGVVSDVWRDVGKKDITQLKALIDKTPANPVLAGQRQTTGKTIPAASAADDATVLAICSATGVSAEQFKAAA